MKHQDEQQSVWENSVDPLAELLFEHTYLNSYQADQLARRILDLAAPDPYGE